MPAYSMARAVETVYRDRRDREVFRETMMEEGVGLPIAIRHRDGIVYLLVSANGNGALYREDRDQRKWNRARGR